MSTAIDAIKEHARGALSFVEHAPGCRFVAEDVETDSTLVYAFETVTFELHLDWRERLAFLLVGRNIGGERPPGSYLHEGRIVRVHLHQVLSKLAPEGRSAVLRLTNGLSAVPSKPWPESLTRQITLYAEALHGSLDRLLAEGALVFPDQVSINRT
ncbi:hypothetical protein F4553_006044 [Allocatelliglobosispora scoriae]|uniref:Uncharacterized protein n=1 Tax=Allocatelliglobosispora scoriae TaxID=643052 RepID=A0A841C0W9_9ACTN|nr:hypothetical protein [Allocatelliglobosispora scoriae]MBB5872610.1 hypothetical protein [Allocatelliglobosispora scoriae]